MLDRQGEILTFWLDRAVPTETDRDGARRVSFDPASLESAKAGSADVGLHITHPYV
jgi:hypothetical protein